MNPAWQAARLIAEGNNTLTGSSVVAPGGDITIAGSTVLINEVHNSASQASQTHFLETAATAQLKSGYVDAAKGAYEAVQTARDAKDDTGSDRMAALAVINVAVSVYNAYQGIKNSAIATSNQPLPYGADAASASAAPISAISVSSSTGVSEGESDSQSNQRTAQGSQLVAGGELNITANGDVGSSTQLVEQKRPLELVPASPKRSSEKTAKSLNARPCLASVTRCLDMRTRGRIGHKTLPAHCLALTSRVALARAIPAASTKTKAP